MFNVTRDDVSDYLHARINRTAINLLAAIPDDPESHARYEADFFVATRELADFARNETVTLDLLEEVEQWRATALSGGQSDISLANDTAGDG